MASRSDEVETGMNTEIDLVLSSRLLLLKHVGLVLVIKEFDYRQPRVSVVDIIPKARSIDDGQPDLEELLFQLGFGDLDLDSFVNLFGVTTLVVGVVLDSR